VSGNWAERQKIRFRFLRPVTSCDEIKLALIGAVAEKTSANKVAQRMRNRKRKNSGYVTTTESYSDVVTETIGKLAK